MKSRITASIKEVTKPIQAGNSFTPYAGERDEE